MPRYWRAYHLYAVRAYDGWTDPDTHDERDLAADQLVYLAEDLSVRLAPFTDLAPIFTDDSSSWQTFCERQLGFAIPDWDAESREVRQAVLSE